MEKKRRNILIGVLLFLAVAGIVTGLLIWLLSNNDEETIDPITLSAPTATLNETMLLWNTIEHASGYQLRIGTTIREGTITATQFDLATLDLSVGTHSIYVRAIGQTIGEQVYNNSPFSTAVSFVIEEIPPVFGGTFKTAYVTFDGETYSRQEFFDNMQEISGGGGFGGVLVGIQILIFVQSNIIIDGSQFTLDFSEIDEFEVSKIVADFEINQDGYFEFSNIMGIPKEGTDEIPMPETDFLSFAGTFKLDNGTIIRNMEMSAMGAETYTLTLVLVEQGG